MYNVYTSSKSSSSMLTQPIEEIIMDVFPNLFNIEYSFDGKDKLYYFKDESISGMAFAITDILFMEYDDTQERAIDIEMSLKTTPGDIYDKISLELIIDSPNYRNPREYHGCIQFNKDPKLSDESCAVIYEMAIDIMYYCVDSQDFIGYDRQRIMRKHTIEKIINT